MHTVLRIIIYELFILASSLFCHKHVDVLWWEMSQWVNKWTNHQVWDVTSPLCWSNHEIIQQTLEATLRPRILLPHMGDYTTHISTHNSTSEGTLHHSNIESHTAPFKTDAELYLGAPLPQHHIHVYHRHSTHTPVVHHTGANTETAFVLLITTSQTQEFTVCYPSRTTSQGIITHYFFLTLPTYLVLRSLTWL